MNILYREKSLLLTDEGIVIFKYYFPLGQPKKLSWSEIQNVKLKPLTLLNGRLRAWGCELMPYWFNFGWRADKEFMFLIDSGSFIKAAITPDDIDAVKKIFEAQGKLKA